MGKRQIWLDEIKAFAIICVVIGHACERTMTGLVTQSPWILYLDLFVNSFHMPLFFMVSGYIYKNGRMSGKDTTFIPFFRKKFIDLFLPYTWFAVLIWGGKFIFSSYVVRKVSILNLFEMFINPVAFLWFIYLLFYISIFIWLLEKVFKDNCILVLLVLIPMTMTWVWFKSGNILLDRFLYYPLFYYIGDCICKYKSTNKKVYISIIALIIYCLLFIPYCNNPGTYAFKIIINLCGSLFFFIVLSSIFRKINCGSGMLYIGKNTMYVYVMHPVVLNALRMLYMKIDFQNSILWIISLVVVGIATPLIYSKIAKERMILEVWFKPRLYINKWRN